MKPLQWMYQVQGRKQTAPIRRCLLTCVLLSWKFFRTIPGIRRLKGTLPCRNLLMKVRLFSYDDLLCIRPDYEPLMQQTRPSPGDTVLDIGAFIGRHTLRYAQIVGPQGIVIAVEPFVENFQLLQTNVRLNSFSNILCAQVAMSDRNGMGQLHYEQEASVATLEPSENSQLPQVPVITYTVDTLCRDYGIQEVDFIKIDVEGSELQVLEGAEKMLKRSSKLRLMIEVHDFLPGKENLYMDLEKWLKARNFTCHPHEENGRKFLEAIAHAPASSPSRPQKKSARQQSSLRR
ncbi:Hypothetical protein PBC10988_11820 [Planctomycetales bacterium 10988]|nr:Hypothetical protein PBC10988_11820 [Planctomycetales bacterium 10988]